MCYSEETKVGMLAAWQEREAARELLRTDQGNSNLRRTLKAAEKRLKRVRFEAVQILFEEFVSQLEVRIKDGDQTSFYKHLNGMDLEGRRSCSVQYMKDEEGKLLRDKELDSRSVGTVVQHLFSEKLSRQR